MFLRIPVHVMAGALVILPASSFLALRVGLVLIAVVPLALVYALHGISSRASRLIFVFLSIQVVLLFLLLLSQSGPGDPEHHVSAFFRMVGVTLAVAVMVLSLEARLLGAQSFINTLIIATGVYCIAKILLVLLPILGLISVPDLGVILKELLGSVVYNYWSTEDRIARITLGNDVLPPFILSVAFVAHAILRRPAIRNLPFFTALVLVSSFLTFTRFIWLYAFVVVIGYWVLVKGKFYLILLVIAMGAGTYMVVSSVPWINEIVSTRFEDAKSIDVKAEQSAHLIEGWVRNPVFGAGIGAFLPHYIRSDYMPFVYEVQWVALLFQVGMAGTLATLFFVLSLPAAACARGARQTAITSTVYLCATYLFFLLGSFTNPYLFILSSSIVYASFYAIAVFPTRRTSQYLSRSASNGEKWPVRSQNADSGFTDSSLIPTQSAPPTLRRGSSSHRYRGHRG